MHTSNEINELAEALAQAQGQFKAVKHTGKNPMFKSKYATFDDVVSVVRKPLNDAGISFMQMLDTGDEGAQALTTMLLHKSGQWIRSSVPLVELAGNRGTNAVQAFGSSLTYMKRYALAAMLGIASDEDDDGNAARPDEAKPNATTRVPSPRRNAPPQPQAPPTQDEAGEQYIDAVEFGVFESQKKQKHLGFMAAGEQWPSARWWDGREKFLEAVPWCRLTVEQLGEVGNRWQGKLRVYYEMRGEYKNATRFEKIEA